MTLAALFLLFALVESPALPNSAQRTDTQPPQPSGSQETPSTAQTPSASQPAATPAPKKKEPAAKKSATHRHSSKKNSTDSPCLVSSSKSTAPKSKPDSTTSSPPPGAKTSAASIPNKDCPPPKIVVRQGGTDEPSIQLAGGPNAQQSAQQRDAINQLLGSAEEDLKKTADMQLSQAQRDTVSQARQFMEQSKAAMAEGDWERAHTLAWKAQLLSEDLVNPQK